MRVDFGDFQTVHSLEKFREFSFQHNSLVKENNYPVPNHNLVFERLKLFVKVYYSNFPFDCALKITHVTMEKLPY